MSLAGLAVAFPLGVGLALVLGVVINYMERRRATRHSVPRRGADRHRHRLQRNRFGTGPKEPGSSAQTAKAFCWRCWPAS
ncbi:MAG: hypothetical protein ACLRMJ_01675 [Alistipes finegoldii]